MEMTNMIFKNIFQPGEKITGEEAISRIGDIRNFAKGNGFPKEFLMACTDLQSNIRQMTKEQFEMIMNLYI